MKTTMWNLFVKREGKWTIGNEAPMEKEEAEEMQTQFKKAGLETLTGLELVKAGDNPPIY